jgi:D-alanyl-D-alanine carboxypeptidase (penicillin-binding protein 5/6)
MGAGVILSGSMIVGIQIATNAVPARLELHLSSLLRSSSTLAKWSWPKVGSASVAIPSLGVEQDSPDQSAVPIASLTKLMTATLILDDLPLRIGHSGPCLTVTAADVANYLREAANDQSVIKVAAGAQLCEIDLLNGLFVHSANNYAELLVRLDHDSPSGFVAKMNQRARALGMSGTHYVDVSGIDSYNVSTPRDLMRLVVPLMRSSLVRSIVRQSSVVVPVAGLVRTYTPLLGHRGVVGIKSGRTDEAGGCDAMAVETWRHGVEFLTYAIVLGQRGGDLLQAAGRAAYALANSAAQSVLVTPWSSRGSSGHFGWTSASTPVRFEILSQSLWWQKIPSPRVDVLRSAPTCQSVLNIRRPWRAYVAHSERAKSTMSLAVPTGKCVSGGALVGALTWGSHVRAEIFVVLAHRVHRPSWWQGLL